MKLYFIKAEITLLYNGKKVSKFKTGGLATIPSIVDSRIAKELVITHLLTHQREVFDKMYKCKVKVLLFENLSCGFNYIHTAAIKSNQIKSN